MIKISKDVWPFYSNFGIYIINYINSKTGGKKNPNDNFKLLCLNGCWDCL